MAGACSGPSGTSSPGRRASPAALAWSASHSAATTGSAIRSTASAAACRRACAATRSWSGPLRSVAVRKAWMARNSEPTARASERTPITPAMPSRRLVEPTVSGVERSSSPVRRVVVELNWSRRRWRSPRPVPSAVPTASAAARTEASRARSMPAASAPAASRARSVVVPASASRRDAAGVRPRGASVRARIRPASRSRASARTAASAWTTAPSRATSCSTSDAWSLWARSDQVTEVTSTARTAKGTTTRRASRDRTPSRLTGTRGPGALGSTGRSVTRGTEHHRSIGASPACVTVARDHSAGTFVPSRGPAC